MEDYVWITKMAAGHYFAKHCQGVLARLTEQYDVKITSYGPPGRSDGPYIQAIREATRRKVAGIMLVGWEVPGVAESINAAIDQGIPVVTAGSDVPQSKRLGYVGTDWFRMGQAIATRLAELIGGKGKVLTIYMKDVGNCRAGCRGFVGRMKDYPGVEILGPEDDDGDDLETSRQIVARYLREHEDLVGIAALNNRSGPGAAMALTEAGKTKSVKLVSVGAEEDHLTHIRSGAIDATFYQKLEALTCLAFQMLYSYNHGSVITGGQAGPTNIPGNIDTGYLLVTADNCDSFQTDIYVEDALEQHQLSQRVALLSSMVESAAEMALAIDADGRITYANPAALRLTSYDREQITRLFVTDLFSLTEEQHALTERCLRDGKAASFETQTVKSTGETFPVQLSLSALATHGGPQVMAGVATDLSEHKKIEWGLRDERDRLRMIMDNAYAGISITRHDPVTNNRRMVMCNDRYVEMSGRTRDQLTDAENLNEFVTLVKRHPLPKNDPHGRGLSSWIRPDGKENYFEWSSVVVAEEDGYSYNVGIDHDVTDRIKAEREARDYQNRLEMIMTHSSDGISLSVMDPKTSGRRLILCNDRYTDMTGRSREELLATEDLDELIVEVEKTQDFHQAMRNGESCSGVDSWKRPDGQENYHEWTAVPFEQAGTTHVIGVNRDITERIINQRKLKEHQERLETIMAYSSDGINLCAIDSETGKRRLIMCNDRFVEMSGYTREQLMATDNLNELTGLRMEMLDVAGDRFEMGDDGRYHRGISSWHRPDGAENYYEWTACRVTIDGQQQVVGIDRDITERIIADRKLREHQNRLEMIMQFAFDGISICKRDPDTGKRRLIMCNDKYVEMSGHTRKELMNTDNLDDLVVWNEGPKDPTEVLRSNKPCRGLDSWKRGDGKENYHEYTAVPIETGGELHIIGIDRDVTDRMRRERELRSVNERLNNIIEFLPDPTFVVDRYKCVIAWNRAIEELTGVKKDQIIGSNSDACRRALRIEEHHTLADLVAAGDPRTIKDAEEIYEHFEQKRGQLFAEIHVEGSPQGTEKYYWLAAAGVRDHQGNLFGAIESIRDITALRQTTRRLEASQQTERRLRERLESLHEVNMKLTDAPSPIEMCRLAVELGRSRLGFDRLGIWFAVPGTPYTFDGSYGTDEQGNPRDETGSRVTFSGDELLRAAMESRAPSSVLAHGQIINHERQVVGEGMRALAPLWDGQKVIGFLATDNLLSKQTITEQDRELLELFATNIAHLYTRKRAEEDLRQAQKMEAVGQLAGGIAHDFNNQLTIIKGYGDLLLRELEKDHPIYEQIEEMHKAAAHAEGLTNQLLAFSRKQVLRPQIINLNEVLTDTANSLGRMLGENVELLLNLEEDLHNVEADPTQIQQVIMNMLVNAWDAMPKGGQIEIETKNVTLNNEYVSRVPEAHVGDHVLMSISDTGVGMDKEVMQRVFEPFFTTKPVGEGTGLGLAMVYGFVRQSGGHISLSSRAGAGATFSVYLPRALPEANPRPPASAPATGLEGTETILVVEDDESIRRLITRVLRTEGYTVLEAPQAREARRMARDLRRTIHLLVTDIVMPGTDGTKLAEEIREKRADIPVLFITAYAERIPQTRELAGASETILTKPFRPEKLARTVRSLLDTARKASPGEPT